MDDDFAWKQHVVRKNNILLYGMRNGLIKRYDEELISKLRKIYYDGVPASIILLTMHLSNGYCYDRSLLLARAFLDSDDDISLIYANVDSIRLNPKNGNASAEHCVVERITPDGECLIYDTSQGLVFDEKLYWNIENPQVTGIVEKDAIIEYLLENDDNQFDNFNSKLIIPWIEEYYNLDGEIYSGDNSFLGEEIKYLKKLVKCNK